MNQPQSSVIVVGSGWAGLAAAAELSRYDIPVTVLECAKQTGGRARRVLFSGKTNEQHQDHSESPNMGISVDNGQHLLIGAYDSTLSLLRTVGIKEASVLKRSDLYLNMISNQWKSIKFKIPRIPAPLHLSAAILLASGLSIKEKTNAIRFCVKLAKLDYNLANDETCLSLFARYRQPHKVIKTLWEPLCLAVLNTHIKYASANVFLRILRETFAYARQDSNLLFTRTNLSEIFPDPAVDFIERAGGSIKLGQRVTKLNIKDNKIKGVTLSDYTIGAPHVILATPYYTTEQLCKNHIELKQTASALEQLTSNPICTVYLRYPEQTTLSKEVVGLMDSTAHWVFDRKLYGQAGLMAVVINGQGDHMNLENTELSHIIEQELAACFPRWPKALDSMVVKEKRATFNCTVDINNKRPSNKTRVKGLWIAGDYTDTNLPATLESAVRSGIRSARGVIDSIYHKP